MVSAGEAANLQKLCDEVKGLSLIEVVEKYGDADTTESPTYSYSPTMVSEFINYLGSTHGWADEIENNLEKKNTGRLARKKCTGTGYCMMYSINYRV